MPLSWGCATSLLGRPSNVRGPPGRRTDPRTSARSGGNVIRLLIAEDNDFVRHSLIEFLTADGCITVVAECADGDEVVAAVESTDPDVVVLDVTMARVGGLEAGRRLLARRPEARVVFLSATMTNDAVREARRMGAVGYLRKADDPEDLVS